MNPAELRIAIELFNRWRRARGSATNEPPTGAFFRKWEQLLEEAGIQSAADRSEAETDARDLEKAGWVELRSVRNRPHFIARIAIPAAAEERWRAAFGFVPPNDEEARRIREYHWCPDLEFVRTSRLALPFDDLVRLNQFLTSSQSEAGKCPIPIKERSLQIFGHEKRLDALYPGSTLFGQGRLTLERLGCEIVGEPLAWKRGPSIASAEPILVIENAATWHSYVRWNARRPQFSAVVYGCGNRFVDGVFFLEDIFRELGGPRQILYFGDLDPQGLLIPQTASVKASLFGLGKVEPHLWSYERLLSFCATGGQPMDPEAFEGAETRLEWLGDLAGPARELFAAHCRLAQEYIGWDYLRSISTLEGPPRRPQAKCAFP